MGWFPTSRSLPLLHPPLQYKYLCRKTYSLWSLPFFSPVKGTKSSLSFCSKASFSRYMRRCSRSNGPVAAFCVWSFCRNPAGSIALWQDRGVSRKEGVCPTDTLLPPSLCLLPSLLYTGEAGRKIPVQRCGCELKAGVSEALLALPSSAEERAPNELRQNTDGWRSLSVFCSCLLKCGSNRPATLDGLFPRRSHLGLARSAPKGFPGWETLWRLWEGANMATLSYF